MNQEKLLRITELTKLYTLGCINDDETAELVQLQKEWLIEQAPTDLNILRSVS